MTPATFPGAPSPAPRWPATDRSRVLRFGAGSSSRQAGGRAQSPRSGGAGSWYELPGPVATEQVAARVVVQPARDVLQRFQRLAQLDERRADFRHTAQAVVQPIAIVAEQPVDGGGGALQR